MVKLRLKRIGKKNQPFYRIVAVDSRVHNSGSYLELLGTYNPKSEKVTLDTEKTLKWLSTGAQPSETVNSLLRKQGILKMFHESKINKTLS